MLFWAFAVGAGLEWMWTYSATPGTAAPPPATWPSGATPARPTATPSLVMFVHPRCPCSRASLAELGGIMERNQGKLAAQVLFVAPPGTGKEWSHTRLWKVASEIPGVTVSADRDGMEAKRFGATTSGHVVLYDANGTLVFSGGITASRGHVGENAGARQVLNLLNGRVGAEPTPVYGCSLDNRQVNTRTTTPN
jgi:hypothetical protein